MHVIEWFPLIESKLSDSLMLDGEYLNNLYVGRIFRLRKKVTFTLYF